MDNGRLDEYVMLLTFILIIISISSPSLLHSRLKPSFAANPVILVVGSVR